MPDCDVGAADVFREDADDIRQGEQCSVVEVIADRGCQQRWLCILRGIDFMAGVESLCSWELAVCGEITVGEEHLLLISQMRYVQVNLAVGLSRPC